MFVTQELGLVLDTLYKDVVCSCVTKVVCA